MQPAYARDCWYIDGVGDGTGGVEPLPPQAAASSTIPAGKKIIRKLRRRLGDGNYDFVHMIPG